jgi:hypothetical protein
LGSDFIKIKSFNPKVKRITQVADTVRKTSRVDACLAMWIRIMADFGTHTTQSKALDLGTAILPTVSAPTGHLTQSKYVSALL